MTRPRPLPISTRVTSVQRLSASLVRVVVQGDDLARFGDPAAADSYVKVLFLTPGVEYPRPIDPNRIRDEFAPEHWPKPRTYTVRAFDRDRLELTLDLVVHGASGLAGPWAAAAQPGDEVLIQGPGGGYTPDPSAAWHLLAGDESALPAIAVALERIPGGVPVTAFIEVPGPEDEIPLARDAVWLHRGTRPLGARILEAVREWTLPDGTGQSFVHGEAAWVRDLRRHLRGPLEQPLDTLSISGYWRLGVDDEGWRAVKRDWNAAVEKDEQAAGVR